MCKQCYAKGLGCSEVDSHEMVKSIVKIHEGIPRSVPYLEPNLSEEDSEIFKAIKQGNLGRIDQLAKDVDALNAHAKNGCTPLHLGAGLSFVEGVKVLLRRGANMDARDLNKHTLLIVAVQYDYLTIVELLLKHEALSKQWDHITTFPQHCILQQRIANLI
jgi:ankyrin repeat protein